MTENNQTVHETGEATSKGFPSGIPLQFVSPDLEERFQRQFFERHWAQNRIAISLGLAIYILFGLVDRGVGGEHWKTILTIRLGVALPLLLTLLTGFYVRRIAERYTPNWFFLPWCFPAVASWR